MNELDILNTLKSMGVRVKDQKIHKNDLLRVLGELEYKRPEWVLLDDYGVFIPEKYIQTIEEESKNLNRLVLPTSFSMARYGKFGEMLLDGVIYQYCLEKNPKNVHYAFKLFYNGEVKTKNGSLGSILDAKNSCDVAAKEFIENLSITQL